MSHVIAKSFRSVNWILLLRRHLTQMHFFFDLKIPSKSLELSSILNFQQQVDERWTTRGTSELQLHQLTWIGVENRMVYHFLINFNWTGALTTERKNLNWFLKCIEDKRKLLEAAILSFGSAATQYAHKSIEKMVSRIKRTTQKANMHGHKIIIEEFSFHILLCHQ